MCIVEARTEAQALADVLVGLVAADTEVPQLQLRPASSY